MPAICPRRFARPNSFPCAVDRTAASPSILGDVAADVFLHVLFRFIHIFSVTLLLGGIVYARRVLVPTLNVLPEETRKRAAADAQERYRLSLYVLLVLIVGSGLYNFLTGPKHGQTYLIWFGIKMLLVAHIIASAILWATSPYGDVTVDGRNKRRLASIAVSGLLVVLISAYLRSLTQREM